jgi:cytochrome c oxidase cbb3-type subunit 2
VFPSVPEPPRDQASIDRGRGLFLDPQRGTCFSCHGESGRGDGPNAAAYEDDWGYPIRPRDFTRGVFRAGSSAQELYQSTATGIGGTPMASFESVLAPAEIWDLVHYVQHLAGGAEEAK